MSVARKLAFSYAVRRPARMLLTSLAMIASACIVVWVVSGYDALRSTFGEQADEYLGRYDFFIVPEDPNSASVDPNLIDLLRKDPAVAEVVPVIQIHQTRLVNPDTSPGGPGGFDGPPRGPGRQGGPGAGRAPGGPRIGPPAKREGTDKSGPAALFRFMQGPPTLVGTDAAAPSYRLVEGVWIDPAHPERRGAVIGKSVAEQMNFKVGDEALLIVGPKEFRLVIAGLIEEGPSQMGMMRRPPSAAAAAPTGIQAGPARSAVYVPLDLARHFSRGKAKINLINIRLHSDSRAQAEEFRTTWERRIAQSHPMASILGVSEVKTNIEEGMMASRAKQDAWTATGLSLLAALFIIFTTLSMGVTERVRQFAVLRAVGLTCSQVARVIAIEAVLLALIGWSGGLLAGWGLLVVAARCQPSLFRNGVSLGTWCILLTGISAVGGALVAAILPAWRAMRVEPLDAMSPSRFTRPGAFRTVALTVAGLFCIAVNPTLVYVASATLSTDNLYYIYMAVGCTTMAVGFLLLTPAAIILVERIGGHAVARLFALEPRLLRSLLSSNLGRSLGTTAALSVGLGLFAAMQIWGYSMLEPFKPGAWNPDMLVAIQRGGLPDAEMANVRAIEGVRPGSCIPLAVEQPKLASDITHSEGHASVIRQDNVIMIGLDPETAFGGKNPLVKVRFVEGNPADCIKRLKAGGNCVVPDHFLRATNLKLGDRFSMIVPESLSKRVEYTIVGAVSLPGWHWMTKFSGLRRREDRSSAIVFADYDSVRRDFEIKQINFVWMDVDEAFGKANLNEVVKAEEERQAAAPKTGPGLMTVKTLIDAKRAAVVKIGEALRPIAARNTGDEQTVNGQGRWPIGATMFGDSVRVSTPDQVHAFIMARAEGMIWASCYLPLITLVVTSLGVVNTVMASVRARQWEFGILRSQGVTRSGLFRVVLAEGLLIGATTCVLSLAFGVLSGWCGTGISQYVSFFGGLAPPLVLPWVQLSIGFGMALGLCLVAAIVPAIVTAQAEPLRLLQAGRGAM